MAFLTSPDVIAQAENRIKAGHHFANVSARFTN